MIDPTAIAESFGRIVQTACLCALPIMLGICGVVWLHEHGIYPLRQFKGLFKSVQGFLAAIAIAALVVYGGSKPQTNDLQRIIHPQIQQIRQISHDGLQSVGPAVVDASMLGVVAGDGESTNETVYALTQNQIDAGFALVRVGTNETHDFSAPAGATVHDRWRLRGANINRFSVSSTTDAPWAIPFGTNWIVGLTVYSTGVLLPRAADEASVALPRLKDALPVLSGVEATGGVLAPFRANLGVVPEVNWPMLPPSAVPSEVWWAITPSNSVVVTYENVLLGRDTNTPVCVQAEFFENGNFVYRYDLSRAGLWNGETVDNVLVGAFNGGHGEAVDVSAVTNLTSLFWHRLDASDTPTGDRDGDGLSTAEEIFRTHTDPGLRDTDGDGFSDGEEYIAGTNPLSRDSDGDGLVDGSDPDPSAVTPLDDLDDDGIPDAYEEYWFGGTNAFDTASGRDETGFTLDAKILGGINPTNAVADANVASTNSLVSWKLFDGFAADWPAEATNLVWERSFAINRTSAWQQFFLSAAPTNAAPWNLRGMVLEWETGDGLAGTIAASPVGDSFRLPLGTNDFPSVLTLRLRATGAHLVQTPTPIHLIAYSPEFRIEGGSRITGQSGAEFYVFLDGSDSQISLAIDHSLRPCRATPGADECDMAELGAMSMENGDFSFEGDATGGIIYAYRPGIYEFPDYSLNVTPSVVRRMMRRGASRRGSGAGGRLVVLDPSAGWSCNGHGCAYDGLGYDWASDWYYEEDYYPLDTKCLRKKWYRDWGGGWHDGACELYVSSGVNEGDAGCVTTAVDGDTGRVYVDGVEVWSDKPEHTYDDVGCGGDYHEDYLGDGCGGCDSDCADGNCDSLEGPDLGSLKFRIPLGAPGKGQVAGFVWLSTEEPIYISQSAFQLLGHPDASIDDYFSSGTRRIVCHDSRGRDLRIENISNGVRITIYDTAAQTLEHTWEIVNVGGSAAQVRLKKISRLNNVMSDETYTYSDISAAQAGTAQCAVQPEAQARASDWTRFDNVAGVGTHLTTWNDFSEYGDGAKYEERTTTDANGSTLSSTYTVQSRIGDCENAVMRETYRSESTGWGWKWSSADYWNDPAHSARHGRPRLVQGNARAWVYADYDENGHETLRVEQRGNAPVPSGFPYVVSNQLHNASSLVDAFVTVRDFAPLSGDSGHQDDAAKPRCETRYVVTNGVAAIIGRTWTRYTRLNRDGYAAVKAESWRAGAQDAEVGDASNAYSYKITYADTGDGTPLLMRNATAETLDENGVLTVNAYSLSGGVLSCVTRCYGPSPSSPFPTYEVVELNASYGTVLRRTTRLTSNDTIIADEQSIYDSQNRLRSTTYLDGTSLTNAYSCCRLLWKRDREGRKTLRSAVTGTDHLYNAMEDVWLADVGNGERGTGNGSTNGFRVTRHYFDALGRETNTVVGISYTPGASAFPDSTLHSTLYTLHSSYPCGGSDYSIATDERNAPAAEPSGSPNAEGMSRDSGRKRVRKVTIRRIDILSDCLESGEAVFTNGVEVVKTKSRTYFGGGSSMRREWDGDKFTEEHRFEDYAADGKRIEYVVTESFDCGIVTNSVSTYDLLGRLVSSAVRGANGSTIVTVNAYDGTTARILSAETTGSPVVTYGYNSRGERASTSQDGTTVLNDTSYETISQQIYRVSATVRMTGSVTNSVQVRKVQLTGLSDALRSRTVSVAASGRETVTETAFDAVTGILTSVSQTEGSTPVTARSICGVTLDQSSIDGASEMSYDALGRNVAVTASDASGATNRVDSLEYDQSGNVVRRVTDFLDGRVAEATAEYDMLNREVRRTYALGNETVTGYDPLGRTVSTRGDAYPIMSGFDSAGRKTHGFTTRDGGATWDETQWEFDPASGLNTAKEYADGSRIAYAYTDNGKKTRTTWARGVWKQHSYNVRNLVSGTTYSGADTPSVAYTYADSGKTASATLSDGTAYAYGYDDRLLNTNESVTVGGESVSVNRTFDEFRRAQETAVVVTNVRHAAKVRLYDSEDRVCGYALTNAAGRGVSVTLAYDGSYVTNTVYTLPNGSSFSAKLSREAGRRNLVTRRDYRYGANSVYWYECDFDLLGRPTNAVDSTMLVRAYGYNNRNELVSATSGTNVFTYAYDTIGNRTAAFVNSAANSYTANNLNQYTSILHDFGTLCEDQTPQYDADGNLTEDGRYSYAYDAENRLVSVTPIVPVQGDFSLQNVYDHRHRRVLKRVKCYDNGEWVLSRVHSIAYDGNNIVLERITLANGETHTIENFWGNDLSGAEDGAGGVGGLLAVSVDGTYCFPCYGNNGNITRYIGEDGSVVARFVYDPYGNIIEQSGPLAELLAIRFCTKYTDSEVELVSYLRRFYDAFNGRWLNRDPIEEEGGANLFVFALNNPVVRFDTDGCFVLPIMINPDPTPPPPSDPSPSIVDQFGFAPLPSGEEKWFERNYAGWLAEARRRFSAEIDRGIDCKSTSFNGPSSRINIEPSENRSGSTSNRTPGGNERQYGDAGQSDWSADKVLGSFSIDYVTPVKITYTNMGGGKRRYNWSTEMYVYDVLGTQEYDPIRRIPVVGDIVGSLTPSRGVKRATWTLSGSGECDCNGRN